MVYRAHTIRLNMEAIRRRNERTRDDHAELIKRSQEAIQETKELLKRLAQTLDLSTIDKYSHIHP